MGRQCLEANDEVHIPMEDQGRIMGIKILRYEENDEHRYPIHEITFKATWIPFRYRNSTIPEDTSASTTVTWGSIHTLIAAAAHVANAEVKVDTVNDYDELTQRLDRDPYSDDDNGSKLIPALIQRQCDDDDDDGKDDDEEDDDDEDNQSIPGLQQRCDDNSSSDDDSVSYQHNFEAETIVDSGATINVITNKAEQINYATVISGMVVPTTKCPDMTDDELRIDKSKKNSEILSVNKDFRKGW
jgi:hypothetical protein